MAMPPDMKIDIGMPLPVPTANFAKLLELASSAIFCSFEVKWSSILRISQPGLPSTSTEPLSTWLRFMSSPDMLVQIANASDRFGYAQLHLALRSQHETVVRILIKSSLMLPDKVFAATVTSTNSGRIVTASRPPCCSRGNLRIVKLLLQQSGIRRGSSDLPVNFHDTTWQGLAALDIAKQRNHVELVKRLECFDVNLVELERQKKCQFFEYHPCGCWPVASTTTTENPYLGSESHNQSHCSDSSDASNTAASAGWLVFHVHYSCVLLLVIGTAASIPSGRGIPLKG